MDKLKIRLKHSKRFDLQRRVVSHMTSASWQNIPHVSFLYEPDITDFCQEFEALAEEKNIIGRKISLNTILLRVIVEGLKSAPELNALLAYHHQKGEGTVHVCEDINISVPWMLPDGKMITPVLSHTETMTLNQLSDAVSQLREKIAHTNVDEMLYRAIVSDTLQELRSFHLGIFRRIFAAKVSFHQVNGLSGKEKREYYSIPEQNRLTAENLISGTVTVSNIGSLYKEQRGYFGILQIIPPQIFSVGLGAVQERPGVYVREDGQKDIGIRKVLPMCLAFDHRAVDFSAVIPFLKRLDEVFSKPYVIHNW
jgi:pyruvate/2-oxoglutarate dehydrogenase complex dihydrolipoamide acyltransferase (E2) component